MKKGAFQMVNIWASGKKANPPIYVNPDASTREETRAAIRKDVTEKLARTIARDVGRLPRYVLELTKDGGQHK